MPVQSGAPAPVRSGAGAIAATAVLLLTTVLAAAANPEAVSRTPRLSLAVPGYAEGAPPGFSGGFGEQSCHACHFQADVNVAPGGVTIAGVPALFIPGERYALAVTLTRPEMAIGGFQLTARFADGGGQAGTLVPGPGEEARIAIERSGGVQYVNQRTAGTALAEPDTARWTVYWTAPEAGGAVRFHVAANAADGDERVDGDFVYTTALDISASPRP